MATVVETHPGRADQEQDYSLEVANAMGDTIAIVAVAESQIEVLTKGELHGEHLQ